jgi:hypothetical protein
MFDSLFVVDRRTYTTLPGVIMNGGQYGDRLSIPRDFLATLETETEEQKVPPGTAPDNGDRVIESTIVPETNNLSIRKTEKAKVPMSTISYETNREGQVVTVTRTLDSGMQSVTPSATVDETVDQKSGGMSLKERKEVPAVFAEEALSIEQNKKSPPVYHPPVTETSVEFTTAGLAETPELLPLEINHTEQQMSVHKKRVRSISATIPEYPTYTNPIRLHKTAQENIAVVEEISFYDRTQPPPPRPTLEGAVVGVEESPHEFPYIMRQVTNLPVDSEGNVILPPSRVEYDTISFTFPGIIANWKARKVEGKVRANIVFWRNRMPLNMTVAARKVITYHQDEPDLTRERFWKVVTRPWAQMYFGLPDNTVHPPAPITLRGESIESNGVLYEISGGQASEPSTYTPGQTLLIGGSSEQWWGGIWRKTLIYVREP